MTVVVVGRDPDEQQGEVRDVLEILLAEAGFRYQDLLWLSVSSKLCPVVNRKPEFKLLEWGQLQQDLASLRGILARLKPTLIITLGNEAAYAVVPEWPTAGREILGAKGIEDRRGYFWDTGYGTVLTTLHPYSVLHKPMPGRFLLGQDLLRGRRYVKGELPREQWPRIERLRNWFQVNKLRQSKLVAWDIETKWEMNALLCSGYCGDDLQPYVATAPYEFDTYGKVILNHCPLVGHNGAGFDIPAMHKFYRMPVPRYVHDTQQMWWALEPDLAGSGDTDEDDKDITPTRTTRKGLAFLASLFFNYPWWKNYPEPSDPQHLVKMVELNGRDALVTRRLAGLLIPRMQQEGVWEQYTLAIRLYDATVAMQLRGIKVNETLRQDRELQLTQRYGTAKDDSSAAGLEYIRSHAVEGFAVKSRCDCCGGGTVCRAACWRCGGFAKKPGKKLQAVLAPCVPCNGAGKLTSYEFNPFSPAQMKAFLYDAVGAPKNVFNNKVTSDAQALKKVLRWAKGA